jgi:hypothetical protein
METDRRGLTWSSLNPRTWTNLAASEQFKSFTAAARNMGPTALKDPAALTALASKHGIALESLSTQALSRTFRAIGLPREMRADVLANLNRNFSAKNLFGSTRQLSSQWLESARSNLGTKGAQALTRGRTLALNGLETGRTWTSAQVDKFPALKNAVTTSATKATAGLSNTATAAATAVKQPGFFGRIVSSAGQVLKPLAPAFKTLCKWLPPLSAAMDGVAFIRNPSLANLGKLALSVGACIPGPWMPLCFGARAAVGVGELAHGLMKKKADPPQLATATA